MTGLCQFNREEKGRSVCSAIVHVHCRFNHMTHCLYRSEKIEYWQFHIFKLRDPGIFLGSRF